MSISINQPASGFGQGAPELVRQSGLGNIFSISTPQLVINVTNTNGRVLLKNPTGSNITMTLLKVISYSTSAGFTAVSIDPTTVPSTQITTVLSDNVAAGTSPLGQLFADSSATAISGGTANKGLLAAPIGNAQYVSELLTAGIFIPTGHSIGLNFTTSMVNATLAFVFTWLEQP